jgi:hypothetical protein
MMLKILLGLFVLGLLPHQDNSLDEVEWYRNEMTTKVVPPYTTAYRILNNDIIERILHFEENPYLSNEEETTGGMATVFEGHNTQENATDETMTELMTTTTQENASDETVTELMTTTTRLNDDDAKLNSNESEDIKSDTIANTDETTENDTVTNAENIIESSVIEFDQTNSEQNRLRVFVSEIGIAANSVYEHLKNASSECEQLHNQTSARIITTTLDISKHEEEIRQLLSTINQLTLAIQNGEHQVRFAEQVVREREAAVQNAERELREAEHRVDRARVCQNGRRKKRFLGFIDQAANWVAKPVVQATNWVAKPVVQAVNWAVVKPVCSVVNGGGIDIAKDARNLAGNTLNDARHRLAIQQQELASKRTQLSNVQLQRHFKNIHQSMLQTQLSKMQTNYAAISFLLTQFGNVKTHLTTAHDSSKILTAVFKLKRLLDFEHVIEPLKALAKQMTKDQLMASFNFEITANTIDTVDRVLDQLSEKLELLPLVHQNPEVTEDINATTVSVDVYTSSSPDW